MSRLFTWLLSLPRILTMAYIYMYFTHALIHVELPLPLDSLYLIWLKSSKLWNATNRWTDIHTVGQKNRSWKNRWSVESFLDSYSDYVTVQFCPFVCMFVHTSGWLSACVCACIMFPPAYIPLLSTPTRLVNSTSVPSPIFHTTLHCEYGIHGGLSRHGILQCSYCVHFTSFITSEVGNGSNSVIIKNFYLKIIHGFKYVISQSSF